MTNQNNDRFDENDSEVSGSSPVVTGALGALLGYLVRDRLVKDPDSSATADSSSDTSSDPTDPDVVPVDPPYTQAGYASLLGAPVNMLGLYDYGINLDQRPFSAIQIVSALVPVIHASQVVLLRGNSVGFSLDIITQQLVRIIAGEIVGASPELAAEGKRFDSNGVYLDLSTNDMIEEIVTGRSLHDIPAPLDIQLIRYVNDSEQAVGALLLSVNLQSVYDSLVASDAPSLLNALNRVPLPMSPEIFGAAASLVEKITDMTNIYWYENRFARAFAYHRQVKPGYSWSMVTEQVAFFLESYLNIAFDEDPWEGGTPSETS